MFKKKVRLQLDSGSDISIINVQTWKKLGRPTMIKSHKTARSVSGEKITFEGELLTNISFQNKTEKAKIFVMRKSNNLFGTDLFEKFRLWDLPLSSFCQKVEDSNVEAEKLKRELKENFPDVFTGGLGRCTKAVAKFEVKENEQPVFKKKRNVPYAAIEQIDGELERLENMGVLEKIDHSEWATPTVYIKKKSKEIRVCADFSTGLNNALKDHHYPLPSPEEIFAKLSGGKYFSKIDLSDAYLQIPVDQECSKLLCINTHKGLYKFNRLPFGVKVAPAIFQQTMDMMLSGLDFAVGYLDDVLMNSASKEQHKAHVNQVFKRIQDYGFKLKQEKCTFFMEKIKYLGQIIDEHGRRTDPDRSSAIRDMPAPENIASLQSFLGLANYYNVFVPNMHKLRSPLNELLRKDQKWVWTQECEEAFQEIKDILTSDLFLAHYNPKRDIIVASDASAYGIGACILHKMDDGKVKPIAHASRSLLPAEKNYSQIEKEALSIIFAVKKFHRFLHGRQFLLQTDHKPLLTIFGSKKGLPQHTANRLQRWGTILLNYNFQMEYVPSKKLGHADGLSRLIPKQTEPLEDMVIAAIQAEVEVKNTLCDTIRELPVTLDEIKSKAEVDEFIISTKEKNQQ